MMVRVLLVFYAKPLFLLFATSSFPHSSNYPSYILNDKHRLQGHNRDSGLDNVQKDPMGGQHSIFLAVVLRTQHEGTLGSLP